MWETADHNNAKHVVQTDNYKQSLDEIEGLTDVFCKECSDYEECDWDKEGCYYSIIPKLKDIINKAKEQ